MERLSRQQISGGFVVASTAPYTVLARVPVTARAPGSLSVLNTHGTATLYLRWIPDANTNQAFEVEAAGVVLGPGRAFTWDDPPRGVSLLARSDQAGAVAAVDGNWQVVQGEESDI